MNKAEIRKEYLQKRLDLEAKQQLRFDDLMLLQFQQFNFNHIQSVLTYWPMGNKNEPNTHIFSSYLRHTIPHLQITYPKSNFETNTLEAILIGEATVYKTNDYGITEPKEGLIFDPQKIDLILMPLIAFDEFGFRVGYGKGLYDKFCKMCKSDVIKIGFSYFKPLNKIDDTNSFDVPLTYCITPDHIYEF